MDSKAQIQHRLNLITLYKNKIKKHNKPYNIAIDICEKQIANLIKKGIDNFLLFDINFLNQPTKVEEEAVEKLRGFAKEMGLIPIGTNKQLNYKDSIKLYEVLLTLQFLEDIKNIPKEYKNGQ